MGGVGWGGMGRGAGEGGMRVAVGSGTDANNGKESSE
jgi:hypothetical protein